MIKLRTLNEEGNQALINLKRKFTGRKIEDSFFDETPPIIKKIIILDTETSGLESDKEEITELCYGIFPCDEKTGELFQPEKVYASFNEISKPLSEKIIELTGITDEIIKGHKIDWFEVRKDFDKVDKIFAHNASFDRGFVEKYNDIMSKSKSKQWVCTRSQIDWREEGYLSARQENIALQNGFFYPSHRAIFDVEALANILNMPNDIGKKYCKMILEDCEKEYFMVELVNSNFHKKDIIKTEKFNWNPIFKIWSKQVSKEEKERLVEWAKEFVYETKRGPVVFKIKPNERF